MAVHSATGARMRPSPQTSKSNVFPAPVQGMDARINVAANNLAVCIVAENLIPSQYGLKVRPGFREWQLGVGNEVRTIIPYTGVAADRTSDKVFAVTPDGIYDVTTDGGTPSNKVLFADTTGDAGFGVFEHFSNAAGDVTLFYADQVNGLFSYDPVADTWAQTTGITYTIDPTRFAIEDVVFVLSHKLRLWLVTKDGTAGWYLDVQADQGEVTPFEFGSKFKRGGELVGLYNWTLDAGDGVDDKLVAISRAGDVIPYEGSDPTLTDWRSIGTFFVGEIPKGNRCLSEYGGNLFILSVLGLTSMAELLNGAEIESPTPDSVGFKIARLLRLDLKQYRNDSGWDLQFFTDEGLMVIVVPQFLNGNYRQYVYNLSTRGWGLYDGVPILSTDNWQGQMMIGDKDGRILRNDVNSDNVDISGEGGTEIQFYVLTSYTDFDEPGLFKQCEYIRPNFVAEQTPAFQCEAVYDFDTSVPLPLSPSPASGDSTWNNAIWGSDVFGAGGLNPATQLQGAQGLGRTVAISMVGYSQSETFLGSWDVAWSTGGFQ